jgi:hypothetical protein
MCSREQVGTAVVVEIRTRQTARSVRIRDGASDQCLTRLLEHSPRALVCVIRASDIRARAIYQHRCTEREQNDENQERLSAFAIALYGQR